MPTDVPSASCWEGDGLYWMARIKGQSGANITQASISSITCTVYDKETRASTGTPSVTVSSAVFDTLQTTTLDPRWTIDSTGYNFGFSIATTYIPNGQHRYRTVFVFTPTSGAVFHHVVDISVRDTLDG